MKNYTLKKIFLGIALVITAAQSSTVTAAGFPWASAPLPYRPEILAPLTLPSILTHPKQTILTTGLALAAVTSGIYYGYQTYKNYKSNTISHQTLDQKIHSLKAQRAYDKYKSSLKTALTYGSLFIATGLGAQYFFANQLLTPESFITSFTNLLTTGIGIMNITIIASSFKHALENLNIASQFNNNTIIPTLDDSLYAGTISPEINTLIQYINNPKFQDACATLNVRPLEAQGILLYGPPGTGKTQLAKYIATQTNTNFIAIKTSDIQQSHIGASAAIIKKLFTQAKNNAGHTIIYFDEIDALAAKRSNDGSSASKEFNSIVATLLSEMDGFEKNQNITVIASTNRKEAIDEAFLRPGRFGIHIEVTCPDANNAFTIFLEYLKNKPYTQTDNTKKLFTVIFDDLYNGMLSAATIKAIITKASTMAIEQTLPKASTTSIEITDENILDAAMDLLEQEQKKNDAINKKNTHNLR